MHDVLHPEPNELKTLDYAMPCHAMLCHAGCTVLLLLHIEPDTLRVGRYQAHAQPEQQDNDTDSKTPIQWTAQVMYQTAGKPFGQEKHGSDCFRSQQLMASPDGMQVVLITSVAGMCLAVCKHLLPYQKSAVY